jgi:hypothetical protein
LIIEEEQTAENEANLNEGGEEIQNLGYEGEELGYEGEELEELEVLAGGDIPPYDAEPDPPAVKIIPFVANSNPLFNEAENELLNEMFYDGRAAQASQIIAERTEASRATTRYQVDAVENAYLSALAAEDPQYFAIHGHTLKQRLATVAPQNRGKASTVLFAMIAPFMDEADQTGDIVGAKRRAIAMMSGKAPKQTTPPAQVPLAPRVPSASSGGTRTFTGDRPADRVARLMALSPGMSRQEAEAVELGMQQTRTSGNDYR